MGRNDGCTRLNVNQWCCLRFRFATDTRSTLPASYAGPEPGRPTGLLVGLPGTDPGHCPPADGRSAVAPIPELNFVCWVARRASWWAIWAGNQITWDTTRRVIQAGQLITVSSACLHSRRLVSRKNWITTLNSRETNRPGCITQRVCCVSGGTTSRMLSTPCLDCAGEFSKDRSESISWIGV
jgi:hypothetical protein